jgi:hypothetical protein
VQNSDWVKAIRLDFLANILYFLMSQTYLIRRRKSMDDDGGSSRDSDDRCSGMCGFMETPSGLIETSSGDVYFL